MALRGRYASLRGVAGWTALQLGQQTFVHLPLHLAHPLRWPSTLHIVRPLEHSRSWGLDFTLACAETDNPPVNLRAPVLPVLLRLLRGMPRVSSIKLRLASSARRVLRSHPQVRGTGTGVVIYCEESSDVRRLEAPGSTMWSSRQPPDLSLRL